MNSDRMSAEDFTDDAVLGGRLVLRQPRRGHRVGHDAIVLAAGVGAAGLALAQRVPGLGMTLIELDPALAALAKHNAGHNGFADRVRVTVLDVAGPDEEFSRHGLQAESASGTLMNPPFNDPARQNVSPDPQRRAAH